MNKRTKSSRFLFVFALTTAIYAMAVAPGRADPTNAFAGPLHAGSGSPNVIVAGGNPADPFVEGHVIEAELYKGLYFSHYHALFYDVNAPVLETLPDSSDGNGRPLWFDGGHGAAMLVDLVQELLRHAQFADLDKLYLDWSAPSNRLADGRQKIVMFTFAISSMCQIEECWASLYQALKSWRKVNNRSPGAAIAEAIYWRTYAWSVRGDGYVGSVDPDAWPIFEDRLKKAQAALDESKSYARGSLWTRSAIEVGMDRGAPALQLIALYSEQAQQDHFYSPIYSSMVEALTPKWGGDWRRVDALIQSATQNTRDAEGESMYARLYWDVARPEIHLFSDTLASWPLMKRGFEDMSRLYPHSAAILNRYAAAACMAQDKNTFQEIMFRLGNHFVPDEWPSNYSLDLCSHKYERQQL